MNKTCLIFIFSLREGTGNAKGEQDEVNLLLICLHLISKLKKTYVCGSSFSDFNLSSMINYPAVLLIALFCLILNLVSERNIYINFFC